MGAIESACLHEDILPKLAEHGIRLVNYADLDATERERLRDYFLREVYPILTPLAVDPVSYTHLDVYKRQRQPSAPC